MRGPIIREMKRVLDQPLLLTLSHEKRRNDPQTRKMHRRIRGAHIVIRTLIILFHPVFLLLWIYSKHQEKKHYRQYLENKHEAKPDQEKRLYFHNGGGVGDIYCEDCGYTEHITRFVHNVPQHAIRGLQCQECGKFHIVEGKDPDLSSLRCDCGGKLSRESPIFCPQCGSYNMRYALGIIT